MGARVGDSGFAAKVVKDGVWYLVDSTWVPGFCSLGFRELGLWGLDKIQAKGNQPGS